KLAEQITTNCIASRIVVFPAPFSPERSVVSPKSITQFSKRCQLISFIRFSFFISPFPLPVQFQLLISLFNVFNPHCHYDRIINNDPGLLISQISVQQFYNLKSAEERKSIP